MKGAQTMPKLLRAPTRVAISPVVDSRRWDGFEPRDDDIIIATYRKSGTTWTQRIVDLLVFQSPDVRPFGDISPWLDATFFNPLEEDLATLQAQTHRRYIKSHLPFDALPLWDTVKFIHVGRDGRDSTLSWQNHQQGFSSPELLQRIGARAMELAAQSGGRPAGPPPPRPEDPRAFLHQWMDELEAAPEDDGTREPTFFGFENTYWRERKRPNLLLVHYNDLSTDLETEMWRISDFLEIDTPKTLMPKLVEAARFGTMKKSGDALFPVLKLAFDRGADRFLNQGKSGRWREYMTEEDVRRYEAIVRKRASPGLATWLERGRLGAGDPRDSAG
jgi:aryl sulfotransferase